MDPNYTQQTNRLTDDFSTGVLTLAHDLSDDRMIYASYSQGSKSGGFNSNPAAIANLTDEEILISAFDFSASDRYVQELYQPLRWVSLNFGVSF